MAGCLRILFYGICCTLFHSAPLAAEETDSDSDKLPPAADKKVDFLREVKPILVEHCFKCHGPEKQESGFRLDRGVDALAGGDSGASVIPGQSAESWLVQYIAGADPDIVMPPEGELLTKEQVGLIRAWIDQGAVWPRDKPDESNKPEHWAYLPLLRPEVPEITPPESPPYQGGDGKVENVKGWVHNPIDAFTLQRMLEAGVKPSPRADRYTLIRRLRFDLLGLPPTVEEVDAFVNDRSPDAYEKLIDRLLKSRHFGERWGRHWLDKARYADSDGYEKDRPRPNAWKYRDWVIGAINDDLPFDRFTIEQLAGDLLPPPQSPLSEGGAKEEWSQLLATAFHRQTLTNTEGGTDQEQFRVEAVFDRAETTAAVWLGLTLTCARCHSHKYDRISQREYYQFYAFFNNGDETNTSVPISEAAVKQYNTDKAAHDGQVAQLQWKIAEARAGLEPALAKWEQNRKQKSIVWNVIAPDDVQSAQGVKFTKQDDGSYLAGGKNPPSDTYTLRYRTSLAGITGFRLEALPDKSLPAQGPGRVGHGNFVLNEFQAAVRSAGSKDWQPLSLTRATADYSQKGWPVAGAVDGKAKTGWAIADRYGKRHTAVFEIENTPAASSGECEVKIALVQQYGSQHTLGRFRLSATTSPRPVRYDALPDNVAAILATAAEKRTEKQRQELLKYYGGIDPSMQKLNRELAALKKKAPKSPYMSVRVISQRKKDPRETHLLRRGDFLQPLAKVQPGTLEVLHSLEAPEKKSTADRLDLARWLMDTDNPLTPRVAVNQIWMHLFGRGLVQTPNDFGVRGEAPTHPELLDWLAVEYRRLGWSRKALIKTILMSSTYRQSSVHRPEAAQIDPENRLLHRQNRFRAEAEIVRDLSLAAGGLLSDKIGGPSVFPPMPKDVAELSYANNFKWNVSKGEDRYRRGMYTFFKRTAPYPNLSAFDCPDSNLTCLKRSSSNTPLQALITLNNEVFVESSQALARRVLSGEAKTDGERLTVAFRICLARPPSKMEQARLLELLTESRQWYKTHSEDAKKLIGNYQPEGAPPAETAAWVAVSRVMMNFDEFITRE